MSPLRSREGSGLWVLVVDDDQDVRESVCELLVAHGYAATTAADGGEALRLLRSSARRPDVVLLDLRMPRCTGWDLLESLRAKPLPMAVPIIVVTADAARPLGAADWVAKPIAPRVLLDAVGRACSR